MVFNLTLRQLEKEVIESLYSNNIDLHPELYKAYSDNLRKAVSGVFGADSPEYFDISQRMQANVSRFAAHKAYYATQEIRRQIRDKNGNVRSFEDYKKASKSVFNKYNRWQVAEYNTAVARSRTAKQWIDFNSDEIQNELYPNLKWLPSRSADPREEHMKFYGLVLPKNHPFWQENQPGNLWNCKCDWEESDEQTFKGNVPKVPAAKGLENNPGETGEIFTENVSYFRNSTEKIEKEALKIIRTDHLDWAKENLTKKSKRKPITNKDLDLKINISTRGIKEYLSQNHNDYYIKNEMIRELPQILKNAEYLGRTTHKNKNSLIFKTIINQQINYLIVRDAGGLFFYGISESSKVLKGIKK